MATNNQPSISATDPSARWLWRAVPIFWAVLLGATLALNTLGVAVSHPERVQGGRGIGLAALLLGLFACFQLFSQGRVYGAATTTVSRSLLYIAGQLITFALLAWLYDPAFAWFSMAVLYQVVAGLPRRAWPVPLLGVFVLLVFGTSPLSNTGTLDLGSVSTGVVLFVSNAGIAFFMRVVNEQRDQLRHALEQVREAHAALAENAAAAQELAVLRERARLARDMHDDIGHALVVMNVKLEAAQLLYARDPARGDAELDATRALIRSTMTSLRRTLADLRAPVSGSEDLPAALRKIAHELQARTGIIVTCVFGLAGAAPPADVRETLWYVAREALANVERHATARHVTLSLLLENDGWRLEIGDDGSGVLLAELNQPGHYGVVGMRERVDMLGGTFGIRRGDYGGSVVEAWVPGQVVAEASAA